MSKPIKRDLLIHTVKHIPLNRVINNSWDTVKSDPVIIERVRIEPTKTMIRGADGDKVIKSTILFWDAVNSGAQNFVEGDQIEHEGQIYTIDQIAKYYDLTLHHLELRLV